jgi:regulatory protein YycI of two-component signal transduction system YycFG
MDWSKAKNILIVIFLALNIILLYKNYDTISTGASIPQEILTNTKAILESRGVKLNCKIPTREKKAEIKSDSFVYDREGIVKQLLDMNVPEKDIEEGKELTGKKGSLVFNDKGFTYICYEPGGREEVTSESDAEKLVDKFLKSLNLTKSGYILENSKKDSDGNFELKFIHKYEDYFIYDEYIKAIAGNNGIKKIEYRYSDIKDIVEISEKKINDAYQVLIKAVDIKDTGIEGIDIGFKKDESDEFTKSSYLVLKWRVILSDGSERYYNAINQ